MAYYIQRIIPKQLTISLKENIPALTGTVIGNKYYFSLDDYNSINLTINGLIDAINLIDNYNENLLLSTANGLNDYLVKLILDNFVCISGLNGDPVSFLTEDIRTLQHFVINNIRYSIDKNNKGHITLIDRYVSGKPGDYVNTWNGRSGHVKGAIHQIKMNGVIQSNNDGYVTLAGLTEKKNYVISINNNFTNEQNYILNSIEFGRNRIELANSTNEGKIDISKYFFINKNNVLTGKNYNEDVIIKLENVTTNNKSAITYSYLTGVYKNESVIVGSLATGVSTVLLPSDYYPLHFYKTNGEQYTTIKWSLVLSEDENIVTLSGNNAQVTYTAMKVIKA